jgi:hypothetical protein
MLWGIQKAKKSILAGNFEVGKRLEILERTLSSTGHLYL